MSLANTPDSPLVAWLGKAAPYLSGAGTGLSAFGQLTSGQGLLEHGMVQNMAAQYAAEQLRQNANAVQGAAQRTAEDVGRNAAYVMSTQLARAAASGGGASDPSVMNLIARTQGETAYRQQVALYGGEARAREMNIQASAQEWSGAEELRVAQRASGASMLSAGATLAQGGVSLFEKYGRGGPGGITDAGAGAG
jgi:hypothetical protein